MYSTWLHPETKVFPKVYLLLSWADLQHLSLVGAGEGHLMEVVSLGWVEDAEDLQQGPLTGMLSAVVSCSMHPGLVERLMCCFDVAVEVAAVEEGLSGRAVLNGTGYHQTSLSILHSGTSNAIQRKKKQIEKWQKKTEGMLRQED